MRFNNEIKNIRIGQLGERIASEYLIKNGWMILFQNYRRKSDELDIIAKTPDGTLIFCEVKTLIKHGNLVPEDNLTPHKFRKISRTCEFFARQHPELVSEEKGWRIDLVAIDVSMKGEIEDIRHYENI